MTRKVVKEVIGTVANLQREGKNEKALEILKRAIQTIPNLSYEEEGVIHHWQGRVYQLMGEYERAAIQLGLAMDFREGDPEQYGYSAFQRYYCRVHDPKVEVAEEEIKEIQKVLFRMSTSRDEPKLNGVVKHNLAYVAQKSGNIDEAIVLYKAAEILIRESQDEWDRALTLYRLGQCHKIKGEKAEAKEYGEKALPTFEEAGDLKRIEDVKKYCF